MSLSVYAMGEIIWVIGIIAWFIIRYPFERRGRRVPVVSSQRTGTEKTALASGLIGLAIVPGFYVVTGLPKSADYPPRVMAVVAGAIIFILAMWVFRRTHKQLGRNWSITLEIRQKHELISAGPYARVRHPMYTSFLLMGLAQAFLLQNWVAGPAGLVGFGLLFFLRVNREERMMLDVFGSEYRAYMDRTKRIIPYLY